MKIYLIRHTTVDIPKGMCYGQTDVPLKESFEEEAQTAKAYIEGIQPEIVFSSPLTRCVRLAHFCGYKNAILDDRLKELHFGDWEGQLWDDLDMSVWKTDWINPPAPNGESFAQMYERVASFFNDLRKASYRSAAVFTHGGVINCARVYFKQVNIEKTFDLMPQFGEIVEFTAG